MLMGIVYYPDLQKHSPCRQPDWRWRRAQWLVANRRHLSHRHDDEKTRRVVAYLRYLRQSHVGQELARRRDPDLACAHSIHSTGGTTRTLIEAHVLARQGS